MATPVYSSDSEEEEGQEGTPLQAALHFRDYGGNLAAAADLLRELARPDGPAGGEWPIAAYELALLQHTRGCHGEADALAKRLGFKTRLADDIFSPGPSPNVGAVPQPPPPGVRVLDQVLSVDLLRQVSHAFGPESPFWPEHMYPTPCFFSYNMPIHNGVGNPTGGEMPAKKTKREQSPTGQPANCGLAERPGGTMMMAIAALLLPVVREMFPEAAVSSVEWWAHIRRGAGAGHQMHWDLDERDLERDTPRHPVASCVLYIDADDGGAATLVTNHNVCDPNGRATCGWMCTPKTNRCLIFDGGLLHGVVPTAGQPSPSQQPRITVMLGFWAGDPVTTEPSSPANNGFPGPNMVSPFAAEAEEEEEEEEGEAERKEGEEEEEEEKEEHAREAEASKKEGAAKEAEEQDGSELGDSSFLEPTWPTLFCYEGPPKANSSMCLGELRPVQPVWVPVKGGESPDGPTAEEVWERSERQSAKSPGAESASQYDPTEFFGRFFLPKEDPACIRQLALATSLPGRLDHGLGSDPDGP